MKTTMFKKFFGWIKSIPAVAKIAPAKVAKFVTNIPTMAKSAYGWAKGVYAVILNPFIKRMCAFITAFISPATVVAK